MPAVRPGMRCARVIEELTEEQARRQIEVNLFGALWVTQAALPILREQGSGWIVQVSSIGGLAAFPLTGIYHASKWALEGFSETLRQEVEPFGIRVLMVEPSGFRTDWAGSSMDRAEPLDAYQGKEWYHEKLWPHIRVIERGKKAAKKYTKGRHEQGE